MKTMAEVLAEHSLLSHGRTGTYACSDPDCGWQFRYRSRMDDLRRGVDVVALEFAAHQADALTAAGFGPVKAAEAPEVRYVDTTTEKGVLDEVVARDAYVHLEAMADNHWWLLVISGGKSVHVNFYTKRAKISGHAECE